MVTGPGPSGLRRGFDVVRADIHPSGADRNKGWGAFVMQHNNPSCPPFQGAMRASILSPMIALRRPVEPATVPGKTPPALAPLDDRVGFWLRLAQQAAFETFHRAMAPLGLTPGRLGTLLLLDAQPEMRQSALAEALRVKPSNLAVMLDGLEADGLIRRAEDAHNRRANVLRLTPSGRALLKRARTQEALVEAELAAGLDQAERGALLAALRRIARG
jgi:DNA-binding MarR family transcriptional regulator